ncbi:MAG: M16 family metallopeptidase [Verrucomicrobiia bacterium]
MKSPVTINTVLRVGLVVCSLLGLSISAQEFREQFEKRVSEFTLDNGLKFIVVVRPEAPVFSYTTYAAVGAVDESRGITGLAHFFEHMAFKGSTTIGTTNLAAELAVFEKQDAAFAELKKERRKGTGADQATLAALANRITDLDREAEQYVVKDEYDRIIQRAGGTACNADTAWDRTRYYFSMPANRLELWFALESDRFLHPVLREFYREREVVAEERRLGENNPVNRLVEDTLATMFKAHPYGQPVLGHMSDIRSWTRQDAQTWFQTYYGASNLTIAVVGDVDPVEVRRLASLYFGRMPKRPKPDPVDTVEPEQQGERRCSIVARSEPLVFLAFHRPEFTHPDNAAFGALTDILSGGRTARLYRGLVRDQKVAVAVSALSLDDAMGRYPGLFLVYSAAAPGHSNADNEQALLKEIEKLKAELVTPEDLAKARNRARAELIRQLNSNLGLAQQLTFYQSVAGDWRKLFVQLERIDRVTAEDVKRIANQYLTFKNRTVGYVISETL